MHDPPQAVPTHAYWQAEAAPHVPVMLQVCCWVLDEHWVWPGMHAPVQTPTEQIPRQGDPSSTHLPESSHFCGCWVLH
jgi:hypothetical protein